MTVSPRPNQIRRFGAALAQPLGAALLFFILTTALTWPLLPNAATSVIDLGDPLESAWTVNWIASRFPFNLAHLFQAPIFSGFPLSLAYDDTALAPGVVAWLLIGLTGNSLLSYNLIMVASFVGNALAVFLLARYVTRSAAAGIIAGCAVAFSTYAFSHVSHLNLSSFYPLPLTLLALHNWLDSLNKPDVVPSSVLSRAGAPLLFVAAFVLQVLCSFYYVAFLAIAVCVVFAWWLVVLRDWRAWTRRRWAWFVAQGAGAALLIGLALLTLTAPYRTVSQTLDLTRTLQEQEAGSAAPLDYFSVSPRNHFWGALFPHLWPSPLFLGVTLLLLAALGLLMALVKRSRSAQIGASGLITTNPRWLLSYFWLALVSLTLSFGPTLQLGGMAIPLPYRLIDLLPGSAALRGPARLSIVVLLGLGVLAGWAVARLNLALPARRWLAAPFVVAITLLMCAEQITMPQPSIMAAPEGVPQAYRWLAAQPQGVLAEFPISIGLADPTVSTQRMYFQGFHHQPLLNGYASFIPPAYHEIALELDGGILEKGGERLSVKPADVGILQSLGVRYVMFDRTLQFYKHADWKSIRQSIAAYPELSLAAEFKDDWLYSIYRLHPLPQNAQLCFSATVAANAQAGAPTNLRLTISNPYKYPLLTRKTETLRLQARWFDSNGVAPSAQALSVATPLTLDPGDHSFDLNIAAPTPPGSYNLELSVVQPAPAYNISNRSIVVTVSR